MKFILGKKLGMTTIFDPEKGARNVTLVRCGKNVVTLERTLDRDSYAAVQVETEKTGRKTLRREFRIDAAVPEDHSAFAVGAELSVEQFTVGERVNVRGITKAKGFQGVVKRHGFKGQTTSHGRKHDMRKPGSIGATFPEHVVKGRRMAGRMGGVSSLVRNLTVEFVDAGEGIIALRGAVPGVNGRVVAIMSRNS